MARCQSFSLLLSLLRLVSDLNAPGWIARHCLCRKEVAFDDGKVLVAKLGDKVVSTSAYCTHYGASLAKGVLTADGRVVCPW
jgi:hypothetical protein